MYHYEKAAPGDFNLTLTGETSSRKHYELKFPAPIVSKFEEGNTAYGELFVPVSDDRVPLVILTHGYGDACVAPCLTLARLLCRQSIATCILYLPVHSRRLPEELGGNYFPPTPAEWLDAYRTSVMEVQMAADWALGRDEFKPDSINVAGISMGGMISCIAMALDERIAAGIFITIGGNGEELSWGGMNNTVGHTCTPEECHALYTHYPDYLREVEEKGLENVVPEKECFLFDTLTFAGRLKGRRVLMINGEDDEMVSRKATLELWEACGEPRLVWLPGTHAGAYASSAPICAEIVRFLNLEMV